MRPPFPQQLPPTWNPRLLSVLLLLFAVPVFAVPAARALVGIFPAVQASAAGPPLPTPATDGERNVLVIASGSTGGNYKLVAEELQRRTDDWCPGCEVEVLTTAGSYDNTALLRDGTADLALLQSDVAYLEYFEDRPFVVLAGLYPEPIHIVVRRELELTYLSELATEPGTFRVSLGARGSGTASHALTCIESLDLPEGKLELQWLDRKASLERLVARDLDVAFITSAVPVKPLQTLSANNVVSLLEIDSDLAGHIRDTNPFFSSAEIPYEAYDARSRAVRTLATRTLLVGRRDLPSSLVEDLLDTLYEAAREGRPAPLEGLDPQNGLEDLPLPAHTASAAYHRDHHSSLQTILRTARRFAIPLIVLLTPIIVFLRFSRVAFLIHQFVLGRILVLLGVIWLLGSAAMYLLEGSKNSSFRSFGRSAIAILHYLFSGFETKYPITTAGHVVAILVLSLGVAVATLFTATVASLLIEHALNVRKLQAKPSLRLKLKDHFLLIGWSERAERILRELRSSILGRPPVVVVSRSRPEPRFLAGRILRGIWSVVGDPGDPAVLQKADVQHARCALVLSDHQDRAGDFEAVASAMAVEGLAPQVHSVVEVTRSENKEHLRHRNRWADEVVDSEDLSECLLSQAVITPGITHVYEELLSFGKESQEIYISPLPRQLEGLCFREAARRPTAGPRARIPIGYRDADGSLHLNPGPDAAAKPLRVPPKTAMPGRHSSGDHLVYIARQQLAPGRALPLRALHRLQGLLTGWRTSRREGRATRTPSPRGLESSRGSVGTLSRKEKPMIDKLGICGWNDRARGVIEELRQSRLPAHKDFAITVISSPEETVFDGDANGDLHENVHFVMGDPTLRRVLRNGGLEELDSLLILARQQDLGGAASDQRALMIALAAADLNPELHIVVELQEPQSREHFKRLPNVEIVSVRELAEKLLAHAAISPGVTEVYLELLTATADSNEIYIVPAGDALAGRTFGEVHRLCLELETPYLPLGFRTVRNDEAVLVLNPSSHRRRKGGHDWQTYPLGVEDALVIMAYEYPNLEQLDSDD